MPTLLIRFPGRRYHATPWGSHVNEGLIEWPPSPWRLLRALLSTGYTALGWSGETPPDDARSLIEKLAGTLPWFRLPPAIGAHTRHYMPLGALTNKGREKTALVFDTWAQVDDGELAVTWDVELTADEFRCLEHLAEHLGYLGRSESWVVARVAAPGAALPPGSDAMPCDDTAVPGPGWEQISLLAANSAIEYSEWQQTAVATALAELEAKSKKGKKPTKKQREKCQAPFPTDLIASMQSTTSWLRKHGWSQPPGSRRVLYWRRADALDAGAPRRRRTPVSAQPVEAMLLSMSTSSGNDHALPPVTRTLPQAELIHRSLVGAAAKMFEVVSPCLSGCDEHGKPLKHGHRHAHVLPLDLDGDGHLEHILIWAPMGLDASAQATVRAVRQTFTKGGFGPIKMALVAAGSLGDLRRMPGTYGERLSALLGPANGATEWVSQTPFVLPRHRKLRGRNSLQGQVAAELASRGLTEPLEVGDLDTKAERWLRLRHFIRSRRSGPPAPVDCGFPVALRLARPETGPICLGYGSHFGLGLFVSAGKEHGDGES